MYLAIGKTITLIDEEKNEKRQIYVSQKDDYYALCSSISAVFKRCELPALIKYEPDLTVFVPITSQTLSSIPNNCAYVVFQ